MSDDDLAERIKAAEGLEREELIMQAINEHRIAVDVLASLAQVDRDVILRMIGRLGRNPRDLTEEEEEWWKKPGLRL